MVDNELSLPGGGMSARNVSEALSPEITLVILDAVSTEDSTDRIVRDPTMMAEARSALETVQRLASPLTKDNLLLAYADLFLIYPQPDFGEGPDGEMLSDSWLDVHYRHLGEWPFESVKKAVDTYIQSGKYNIFPKPADLIDVAKADAMEIKLIAYRLRRAVESGVTRAVPEKTEEDRAKVRQMMAEMRRGPGGKIKLSPTNDAVVPLHNHTQAAEALRRIADRHDD